MGNGTTGSTILANLLRLMAAILAYASHLAAREVHKHPALFKASPREDSRRFQELLAEGHRPARGPSRFLRQHSGKRSEKLAELIPKLAHLRVTPILAL